MRYTLPIKCYNCEKPFEISAEAEAPESPDGNLVDVVIPCPFCNTANQVRLKADKVKVYTTYRDGEQQTHYNMPDDPAAFFGQVIDGQKTSTLSTQ